MVVVNEQPTVTPTDEAPAPTVAEEAATPTQVVIRKSPKALSQRDPVVIAEHFWKSGFFKDVKSMSQAVVKVIAGEELGLGPFAAIKGITMIEGQLGFTANLVATKVMQHPDYRYEVKETTNQRCVIDFFEGDTLRGTSEFTIEDAERAGLVKAQSNWEKWPKAMCFNRALTQGVRAYIPDVTAGIPAYTDEEIEEVVTETGGEVAEVAQESGGLEPATLAHLVEGIEIAKPQLEKGAANWLDGLNLRLGALDIDAFSPTEEVEKELAKLTEEQAAALDGELQKLADEEIADAEVVEEDTHADA